MMPRLVIVRHGEANPGADHDADRTLTPSGEHEAVDAGQWLAQTLPDAAILSSPY